MSDSVGQYLNEIGAVALLAVVIVLVVVVARRRADPGGDRT